MVIETSVHLLAVAHFFFQPGHVFVQRLPVARVTVTETIWDPVESEQFAEPAGLELERRAENALKFGLR